MSKKFSQFDIGVKKVLFDAFCYHAELKKRKIIVEKQKDFSFDTELSLLDVADKKVMAVFLGILNSPNGVNEQLSESGINKKKVLEYLNLENFELPQIGIEQLVIDEEFVFFLERILKKGSVTLEQITSSLYRNFLCESDIISNFYYAMISIDRDYFNQDKRRFSQRAQINLSRLFNNQTAINMEEFVTE